MLRIAFVVPLILSAACGACSGGGGGDAGAGDGGPPAADAGRPPDAGGPKDAGVSDGGAAGDAAAPEDAGGVPPDAAGPDSNVPDAAAPDAQTSPGPVCARFTDCMRGCAPAGSPCINTCKATIQQDRGCGACASALEGCLAEHGCAPEPGAIADPACGFQGCKDKLECFYSPREWTPGDGCGGGFTCQPDGHCLPDGVDGYGPLPGAVAEPGGICYDYILCNVGDCVKLDVNMKAGICMPRCAVLTRPDAGT